MVCLALTALPCQALDIGRANVNSALGEPLDAHVRIRLDPGERIDNSCLSVGDQNDFPESDHVLISDVQLSLMTSKNAIRITTSKPLDVQAASMALRIRCADGLLTVRALNLYLNPPTGHVSTTSIMSSLPGTSITVRSGDSVYGLARTIFPKNEKAVRDLALAIALANPVLFPEGRPRPVQVGERLAIPDLRTIQRIVADSGIDPTAMFPPAPQTATSRTATSQTTARPGPSPANTSSNRAKPDAIQKNEITRSVTGAQRRTTRTNGTLRLILALNIDLTPSKGMTEARRATLREGLRPVVAIRNTQSPGPGFAELTLRITRIREVQNGLDAHLTRLDSKVAAIQKSATVRNRTVRPSLPAAQATLPVGAPSLSAAPLQTASRWWQVWSWQQTASWWRWPMTAGVALLLVAAIVFRGKLRASPSAVKDRKHLDSMLKEAGAAATPLMGSEPARRSDDATVPPGDDATVPPGTDSATIYRSQYDDDDQSTSDTTQQEFERQAAQIGLENSIDIPDVDTPYSVYYPPQASPDSIDPGSRGDVEDDLRREMDDALDGARSMFTDVDRFIALGRTENALSLLEFQVKKDPEDRGVWVKLLAIYEQEGMRDKFESTHAAFNKQFKIG